MWCLTRVTQPPDDHTQRFDPYRDDDSTRAMPPVPPGNGDDETRIFPFDDDRTRQVPPYDPYRDDATRAYGAAPDATAAMPPVSGGPARGAATPVPPGGNVYGGTPSSAYPGYDDDEYDDEPRRDGKRTALIVGGIVAAIAIVILGGMAVGNALLGGDPGPSSAPVVSLPPTPSDTPAETPTESPSPTDEFSVSPPPPEGPGPRILALNAPERVPCDGQGHDAQVELSWTVRGTDKVVVSKDGAMYQEYAPDDSPVTVPFPCDGQAHTYQVTALSNDDRQSRPQQLTVRPEAAQPTGQPLFPAPGPS